MSEDSTVKGGLGEAYEEDQHEGGVRVRNEMLRVGHLVRQGG